MKFVILLFFITFTACVTKSPTFSITLEQFNHVVRNLLDHNVKNHHVMFKEGSRANHVTHALIALSTLNASNDRLLEFYNFYIKQLDTSLFRRGIKPEEINNLEEFLKKLGNGDKVYLDYFNFFEKHSNSSGIRQTVNIYFPYLLKGSMSSALHALIELGYGIEMEHEKTIIQGLSWIASKYVNYGLSENNQNQISREFLPLLLKLQKDDRLKVPNHLPLGEAMKVASEIEAIKEYDIHLSIGNNEQYLRQVILKLRESSILAFYYTGSKQFFLLHGVTGLYSLENILKVLNSNDVKIELSRMYWRALMLVYIGVGKPEIRVTEPREVNWEEVLKDAVKSNDAHTIKIINVANEMLKDRLVSDRLKMVYKEAAHNYLRSEIKFRNKD